MLSRLACIRVTALCALLFTVPLIGGCGSGSHGTQPLSKRVYIERLNAVQRRAAPIFANAASSTKSPATARAQLRAMDGLIADVDALRPPVVWRSEQDDILEALRTMRAATDVLARAAPSNRTAIQGQIARYRTAQEQFRAAVASINATR
jgi:hypothetical protein